MARFTRKSTYEGETLYGSPIGIKCDDFDQLQNVYNKLGILEDLEEKLGCPLEVVFKAIEDGIYDKKGEERSVNFDYNKWEKEYYFNAFSYDDNIKLYLRDYKRTWWLKKDRSE